LDAILNVINKQSLSFYDYKGKLPAKFFEQTCFELSNEKGNGGVNHRENITKPHVLWSW